MVTKTRLAALAAATVLVLIVLALLQDHAIKVTANSVRDSASVYLIGRGMDDQRAIDRTLALLDHALNRTGAQWNPTDGRQPISIYLYPSIQEMSQSHPYYQGSLTLKGYVQCRDHGAAIHMPLHSNRPLLPDRPESQVANHEAVHAAMCQNFGIIANHHAPLWLHEGQATNLQANPLEKPFVIAFLKLHVAWAGPQTTDGIEFCYNLPVNGLPTYATSTLFLRHVEEQRPDAANRIMAHIAAGNTFTNAFQQVTQTSCHKAYEAWAAQG